MEFIYSIIEWSFTCEWTTTKPEPWKFHLPSFQILTIFYILLIFSSLAGVILFLFIIADRRVIHFPVPGAAVEKDE